MIVIAFRIIKIIETIGISRDKYHQKLLINEKCIFPDQCTSTFLNEKDTYLQRCPQVPTTN